jgi:hypothetical protein
LTVGLFDMRGGSGPLFGEKRSSIRTIAGLNTTLQLANPSRYSAVQPKAAELCTQRSTAQYLGCCGSKLSAACKMNSQSGVHDVQDPGNAELQLSCKAKCNGMRAKAGSSRVFGIVHLPPIAAGPSTADLASPMRKTDHDALAQHRTRELQNCTKEVGTRHPTNPPPKTAVGWKRRITPLWSIMMIEMQRLVRSK